VIALVIALFWVSMDRFIFHTDKFYQERNNLKSYTHSHIKHTQEK